MKKKQLVFNVLLLVFTLSILSLVSADGDNTLCGWNAQNDATCTPMATPPSCSSYEDNQNFLVLATSTGTKNIEFGVTNNVEFLTLYDEWVGDSSPKGCIAGNAVGASDLSDDRAAVAYGFYIDVKEDNAQFVSATATYTLRRSFTHAAVQFFKVDTLSMKPDMNQPVFTTIIHHRSDKDGSGLSGLDSKTVTFPEAGYYYGVAFVEVHARRKIGYALWSFSNEEFTINELYQEKSSIDDWEMYSTLAYTQETYCEDYYYGDYNPSIGLCCSASHIPLYEEKYTTDGTFSLEEKEGDYIFTSQAGEQYYCALTNIEEGKTGQWIATTSQQYCEDRSPQASYLPSKRVSFEDMKEYNDLIDTVNGGSDFCCGDDPGVCLPKNNEVRDLTITNPLAEGFGILHYNNWGSDFITQGYGDEYCKEVYDCETFISAKTVPLDETVESCRCDTGNCPTDSCRISDSDQWSRISEITCGSCNNIDLYCSSLTNGDCQSSTICYLNKFESDSDYTYLTDNNQYLCLDDKLSGDKGVVSFNEEEDSDWYWWNAENNEERYLIHAVGNNDVIANGDYWYTCDVNAPLDNSDDQFIGNLQTFPGVEGERLLDNLCEKFSPYPIQEIRSDYIPLDQETKFYDYAIMDQEHCKANTIDYEAYVRQFYESDDYEGPVLTPDQINEIVADIAPQFSKCCYVSGRTGENAFLYGYEGYENVCDGNWHFACETVETEPGNPSQGGDQGSSSTTIGLKEDVIKYTQAEKSYPQAANCTTLETNLQTTVDECTTKTQVCVPTMESGYTAILNDGTTCCVQGLCKEPERSTCNQLGGFLIKDSYNGVYVCDEPENQVAAKDGTCCIGNLVLSQTAIETLLPTITSSNESYICYEGSQEESFIGECCYGDTCVNLNTWYESNLGADNGRIFSSGSQLGTVISFDYLENNILNDGVLNLTIDGESDQTDNRPSLVKNDWSAYETLTFDVYYEGAMTLNEIQFTSSTGEEHKIILKDHSFLPQVRNKLLPNVWHHITIDITEDLQAVVPVGEFVNIGFTLEDYTAQPTIRTTVLVDNFVLHREPDEALYCSGPFLTWIDDLKPEETDDKTGFSAEELGPAMMACNDQLSYSWTGTQCCGANTKKSNSELFTDGFYASGDYYLDTEGACFGGVKLNDGDLVSEAYGNNLDMWPHLLYSSNQGEDTPNLWSCATDIEFTDANGNAFTSHKETYDADPEAYTLIRNVPAFSIVGDYYCDPSTQWLSADKLKKVKVLAAKMYSLAGDDYTLHCDNFATEETLLTSHSLTSLTSPKATSITGTEAATACVLTNKTEGESHVIIGLPLETTEVNTFLAHIQETFYPQIPEDKRIDCTQTKDFGPMPTTLDLDQTTETFFTECAYSGPSEDKLADKGLQAYYNEPMNLLLLSMYDEVPQGFLANVWTSITEVFTNLFAAKKETGGIEENQVNVIPLDLDYQVDFSYLYLARSGELQVKGVIEQDQTKTNYWYGRIDYENLTTSVSPLVEGYYSAGVSEEQLYLCAQETTQSIFIRLPSTTEKSLDWRYLTSNLRLQQTGVSQTFNETSDYCWLHNGKLDQGEECDDTLAESGKVIVSTEDLEGCEQCINGKIDGSTCGTINSYVLFATSETYGGNLGGLAGADQKCREAATAGGFPKANAAKAVLSTSLYDAKERFDMNIPVYMNDADQTSLRATTTKLFNDFAYNDYFIYDEYNNPTTANLWTGSTGTGTKRTETCNDWTDNNKLYGEYGNPGNYRSEGNWLEQQIAYCRSAQFNIPCLVPQ